MSALDVRLNDAESIRDFYSEVFVASYLKSISHDSTNDRDLESAALQAQRIADIAIKVRANVNIIDS